MLFSSLLVLLPLPSQAYNTRRVSVELQYHTYTDLVEDPGNPRESLSDTLGVNFNLRFYRTFSFVISAMNATDDSLNGYGLGLRVDLPGIFFVGGAANDFVRRKKKRRFNTYLQWTKFAISEGVLNTYVADRLGFGLDILSRGRQILDDLYLNFEFMTYSHQGNQFLAFGTGIGYEF